MLGGVGVRGGNKICENFHSVIFFFIFSSLNDFVLEILS